MKHVIVFASGQGSNAAAIIDFFAGHDAVTVALIVCNNPKAGVVALARAHGIPLLLIDKATFSDAAAFARKLEGYNPALIVLAGFLWKVPETVVRAFAGKIINIHPALLPKYGGKGMYGMRVHEAVKAAGEAETGITIHWVNEHYDEGAAILQAYLPVAADDSPERIAQRIHRLEHYYLPRAIAFLLD